MSSSKITKLFNSIPDEIVIYILKFLSLEDILVCEKVCLRWSKLSLDSDIWRNLKINYSGKPGQTEVSKLTRTNNNILDVIKSHSQYIINIEIQYVYNCNLLTSLLKDCVNLTSLKLVMCRLQSDFVDLIKLWPKLNILNLENTILIQTTNDCSIDFKHCPNLTFLGLSDFGLSSNNFSGLIKCTHLSHILIDKVNNLKVDDIQQLIVTKQTILNTLHIYGGDAINDHCMTLLSHCPVLSDLGINRCENLTDVGLLSLRNLKNIKHLYIWNNDVFTEEGILKTLGDRNLFGLNSLSLSRIANITPVIVDVISEFYKDIKFIALYQCPRLVQNDIVINEV